MIKSQHLAEEVLQPGILGAVEQLCGAALLQDLALGHETPGRRPPGKAHSWVTTAMVMPSLARLRIRSSTSPTISGPGHW